MKKLLNPKTLLLVYNEKLILEQLLKLAKAGNFDLIGETQHGFKSGKSGSSKELGFSIRLSGKIAPK